MRIKPEEITSVIRKEIERFDKKVQTVDSGTVVQIGDGVARIYGLDDCMEGELLEMPGGIKAMALNLEYDNVGAVVLGPSDSIKEGDFVRKTGRVVEVPVGEEMIGRVVNSLGEAIDGKGHIEPKLFRPVEIQAPGIIERKSVTVPLETGIKAIDSMVPIGRGQRELIIGDRQTGKTQIALDTILNQKNKNVLCIYVAIGQKQSNVANIYNILTKAGAMDYTTIVAATAAESAPLQYLSAYTGCTIGEYFMNKGRDVLIVYDDLSKHAVAYRAMSLLLRRPPGREAYPGDVFYIHSRLLERAARLSDDLGGGSMTALPIVETLAGDITAYIPTNVISITDGQIFLESDLFYNGIRPAINPGISVSRVGGNAQTKAMKRVAGKLRLDLAQYRELESFAQFGTDLDESSRSLLDKGQRIVEVLKQQQFEPMRYEKQIMILYAVMNNKLNQVAVREVRTFEREFLDFMDTYHASIGKAIISTGELSPALQRELDEAIEEFTREYYSGEQV
ncbi:F0F1 ATP synthase subunit alpha [Proteiniclasticum sp. QWL-01]|uniref:F0F1 ATP synthase subunit alpha n=1 Tax=Proteiniclasticum sp. QWL-01 TaxID=3036945 RepID=UPI0022002FA5|nr:F0F1 ATP synthase subunit alpha [Proteiniclasticum sp. QWL-01]UUM12518.1 F0F1 ATP synthase subunit alpha [Clostridiaceae bacterium HFYG-1003]WFF74083.1 F0F1 ATP synthase subunit alpha [Proteiniclasticum sp. QWL-01]